MLIRGVIDLYVLNYSILETFYTVEDLKSSSLFLIRVYIYFFIVNLFNDILSEIIRKVYKCILTNNSI